MTFTDGFEVNLAVLPIPARVLTVAPIDPSVEPDASYSVTSRRDSDPS